MTYNMYGYTNEQIIEDLKAAAQGSNNLSSNDYEARGTISLTTVRYHFGTWNQAVIAAGLIPIKSGGQNNRRTISDEELLDEITKLMQMLGKRPTESEMSAKGKFSVTPYRDRWGSLKIACEKAANFNPSSTG